MAGKARKSTRKDAVSAMKRGLILDAARKIFEREGLEGASLRAIAAEAGYTPAALYFHFDSKEAVYAALLSESLDRLTDAVETALDPAAAPADRLAQGTGAFFRYYAANPGDLELGFYLFRGGMRPKGVGTERDAELNGKLIRALEPVRTAVRDAGVGDDRANEITALLFAQASGALLLGNTGRLRLFSVEPERLVETAVRLVLADIRSA